ncbi:MAG: GAF domain-containing protein [Thermonemataceae bacterium]|nr:GAF domain-containing protein [Thermonemataceae bacterium]
MDFKTIQGKLTGGFLSMALISFILIQAANYQWNKILENRNLLIEQVQPTKFYAAEVLDKVQESFNIVEKGLLFSDERFWSDYDNIAQRIANDEKLLKKHIDKSNNNNLVVLYAKLDNQIGNYKKELRQLRSIYLKRREIVGIENVTQRLQKNLQTDVASIIEDIAKTSQEIINLQALFEEEQEANYQELKKWRNWIIFFEFLAAVAVAATIGSVLIVDILKRVRVMRDSLKTLAKGDIPPVIEQTEDELNSMIVATNELISNLEEIEIFAKAVGNGDFSSDITVFDGEGDLGGSLIEMRDSLKKVYEQEELRAWATQGLAKFSEILRKNNDNLENLCNEVISEVVKYININQGGIFILNKNAKEPILELKGAYAFNKKKNVEKVIRLGEGLLGQAFLEGEMVYIPHVPENYMKISSGLGNLEPKSLLILPLKYDEESIGVMELASFEDFQPYQIDFLKSIAEVTASTVISVFSNDSNRLLLLEMQSKTEAIKHQEEQLRSNAEQLSHNQEELSKNLDTAERELFKLQQILNNLGSAVLVYNDKGIINFANQMAEKLFMYEAGEMFDLSIRNVLEMSSEELRIDFATNRLRRSGETNTKEVRKIKASTKNNIIFLVEVYSQVIELNKEKLLVVTLQKTDN